MTTAFQRPSDPDARKPLVLLEPLKSAEIVRARVAKVEPALAAAAQAEPDPERCLRRLIEAGEGLEAERFLAAALRRRVQVWWGYVCVLEVLERGREHRATLAASGGGVAGAIAAMAALPPVVPGAPAQAVLGVSPDIGLTAEQFQPPPPVVGGVDISDPGAWPKPSIAADGTLRFLPPVLEPLRDNPLRQPDGVDLFFARRQAFIQSLPPAARASFLAKDAGSAEAVTRLLGRPIGEIMADDRANRLAAAGAGLDADPQAPHHRIKAALAAKKAEVQAACAAWTAKVQLAVAGVPRQRPPDLTGDTAATAAALAAVRTWVLNPIAANGRAAMAIGEKCEGMEQAAGMLAMACHFSGTDLGDGADEDIPPVPPPAGTAPAMVFAALEIARATPDTGRTPDEWLEVFLDLGVQVAQGLLTWDVALHQRQVRSHPWAGRSGFGRSHAQPATGAPPPDA
ncbi:MAG: hypothetical protein L6R48_00440 [Planctomycetes bacterium]|nr:hypothetical protein [Planctomycetota bacterium]